ncbi:hypothetical protein [Curtobacterium sp. DN_7.5]|uniref:hypothetical protein n=1 Tax=Curtobacterium sp. DN_7.5 TaxID=3049047 RepID=UPI001F5AB87E|nr:hypothetical protein [Curtobacterium sp. DN_7.5]
MPEYRPMPGYELGQGWTGTRRRRSRSARVRRWAGPPIGLFALVAACLLVRWYAGVAHTVVWECAVSSCGTNDPRSFAPIGSWVLVVLAAFGVRTLPGRGWWTGVAVLLFGAVAGWSIDWWRTPGIDLELFVTPIAAGVVGLGFLLVQVGLAVDRARGRAHVARRRAARGE